MKLKKIASLVLAGLMAVSMLAGCGDNSSSNNNGTVVEPGNSTIIVDAANDAQDPANKVKVTFTSDAKLLSALQDAIELKKGDFDAIQKLTGANVVTQFTTLTAGDTSPDEVVETMLVVDKVSGALNETAAAKMAGKAVNEIVNDLKKNTLSDSDKAGTKYYAYSYEGTIVMASSTDIAGNVTYYVAGTITRTAAKKTLER